MTSFVKGYQGRPVRPRTFPPPPSAGPGCSPSGRRRMKVLQAYRFALDPTPRQQRALASHVGARRRLQLGALVLDRDENAARNLAALAAAVAGSGPETQNARGRDGRPATRQAIAEEAGSRHRRMAG
ncbi:MAG: hypothetical protein DIU76_11175 [Bacillota bacterium]|nr:MAG: hypothetical protein DIU76_11175 [Bacillota bacterium]